MKAAAAPGSVDAYFAALEPAQREVLTQVRECVRRLVPQGEERISYGMPTMFFGGVVVHYAAFRKHLGLYPPVADPTVRERVAAYAGPKGNLQFPWSRPLPLDLIGAVVRARLHENVQRAAATRAGPRKTANNPPNKAPGRTPR